MKKYELHPTMEYPEGQELSPSQKLVEKLVEVLALNPDDSWDRNRMEQVVAFWLRIGRSTAKYGISCAIMDGFLLTTSGVCEADAEAAAIVESTPGNLAEIVHDVTGIVVKDNLEGLAEAEKGER